MQIKQIYYRDHQITIIERPFGITDPIMGFEVEIDGQKKGCAGFRHEEKAIKWAKKIVDAYQARLARVIKSANLDQTDLG